MISMQRQSSYWNTQRNEALCLFRVTVISLISSSLPPPLLSIAVSPLSNKRPILEPEIYYVPSLLRPLHIY